MKQIHVIRQVRRIVMLMLGALMLAPVGAMAGMLYNTGGYAPNSRSPVVGGFAEIGGLVSDTTPSCVYQKTTTTSYYYYPSNSISSCPTMGPVFYRPFGDVVAKSGTWGPGGTWYKGALVCPNNTAAITLTEGSTGQGYMADNGAWYNAVYAPSYFNNWFSRQWAWRPAQKVVVCVDTDTASGWYGGQ